MSFHTLGGGGEFNLPLMGAANISATSLVSLATISFPHAVDSDIISTFSRKFCMGCVRTMAQAIIMRQLRPSLENTIGRLRNTCDITKQLQDSGEI